MFALNMRHVNSYLFKSLENTDHFEAMPQEKVCLEDVPGLLIDPEDSDGDEDIAVD